MTKRVTFLVAGLVLVLSAAASGPVAACQLCVRERVCEPEIPCYWIVTCQDSSTLITGFEECDDLSGCQTSGPHCIWT